MNENQMSPPPAALMTQLMMGCFISQAVCVAAKLGIADLLAEQPLNVAVLAAQTETHQRSLYRLLRSLASVGVFTETADKVFGNTPVSATLLSNAPDSLRDATIFMGEDWHWRVYSQMMHSVKTGEAAWKEVHGLDVFPYFQQNPSEAEVFNRAMSSYSKMALAVVAAYDFADAQTLCDIAGGHGVLLSGFLKANPHLQGVLFDTPEVIEGAPALLEREGVGSRVTTVAGDFFESVPTGGDVYMMKHIIHDWDDARSMKILSNIARAMNPNGKVLIIEQVIPAGDAPHIGKLMDLEMLVSPGGIERTAAEYDELLQQSGLRLNRIIATESPLSIVEAGK